MAQFSRNTLFVAYQQLRAQIQFHTEFNDLMYRWELDELAESQSGGISPRLQNAFKWLKNNPDHKYNGEFVVDLFVIEALNRGASDELLRSLERDGFVLEQDGTLRRMLPVELDLPVADDEVHVLLDRYRMATSKGHLDQGVHAHTEGNWAAANSQFRTFFEALFDEIAMALEPMQASTAANSETRRQLLANRTVPFLSRDLNEWSNDGKNFVNGTFKRLHPQGSHPGLSDEEDSTFRLHLVLLSARVFLRRLDSMKGGRPR